MVRSVQGANILLYVFRTFHVVHAALRCVQRTRPNAAEPGTCGLQSAKVLACVDCQHVLDCGRVLRLRCQQSVDADPQLTVSQTTQRVNATQCAEIAHAALKDNSLYDAYDGFHTGLRLQRLASSSQNVLALLQVVIAFRLVVKMPHHVKVCGLGLRYMLCTITVVPPACLPV